MDELGPYEKDEAEVSNGIEDSVSIADERRAHDFPGGDFGLARIHVNSTFPTDFIAADLQIHTDDIDAAPTLQPRISNITAPMSFLGVRDFLPAIRTFTIADALNQAASVVVTTRHGFDAARGREHREVYITLGPVFHGVGFLHLFRSCYAADLTSSKPSPSQQDDDGDAVQAARGRLCGERGLEETPPPDRPPWPPPLLRIDNDRRLHHLRAFLFARARPTTPTAAPESPPRRTPQIFGELSPIATAAKEIAWQDLASPGTAELVRVSASIPRTAPRTFALLTVCLDFPLSFVELHLLVLLKHMLQSPSSMASPGVTGAVKWDSGVVFAKFLEHAVDSWRLVLRSTGAVNLGPGRGLVLCVAALLGAHVVLTNLPDRFELLRKNVHLNMDDPYIAGSAQVTDLVWGKQSHPHLRLDFVLGSDVIYNEEAEDELLLCLKQLSGQHTTVLLAGELRNDAVLECFAKARALGRRLSIAFGMIHTPPGRLRVHLRRLQYASLERARPAFHVRHPGAQLRGALARFGQLQLESLVTNATDDDVMLLLMALHNFESQLWFARTAEAWWALDAADIELVKLMVMGDSLGLDDALAVQNCSRDWRAVMPHLRAAVCAAPSHLRAAVCAAPSHLRTAAVIGVLLCLTYELLCVLLLLTYELQLLRFEGIYHMYTCSRRWGKTSKPGLASYLFE